MVAPTKDAAGHVEGYEIFIKYLPQEATAPELKAWFGEAGEIVGDVRLMTNPATGAPPLPAPPLPPPPLPPPPLHRRLLLLQHHLTSWQASARASAG